VSATVEKIIAAFLPRLEHVKGPGSSGNFDTRCLFHEDRSSSFSRHARGGLWQCRAAGCGRHGNVLQLAEALGIRPARPSTPIINWGLDAAMVKYRITVHPRDVLREEGGA
jgi:hypothetical protein